MIYYFSSSTCEPCQKIKPTIQELQEDFPFEWKFLDLDSAEAKEFDVKKVPTMVVTTPTETFKHSGSDVIGYYKILRQSRRN
jgi:thiol-disulfide isomerase/thioredoxin